MLIEPLHLDFGGVACDGRGVCQTFYTTWSYYLNCSYNGELLDSLVLLHNQALEKENPHAK